LRFLTLFEVLVRRGQARDGEDLGACIRASEADDGSSDGTAGVESHAGLRLTLSRVEAMKGVAGN